ncbi:elongation factor P hydroxylase [Agaribacterium sp. ZY112]|uniref:elongation factor P hydroxylase n=1 Tax=Agaribacterium sp. ZY112 TaxID=3233574 RepID=UPI003525F04F
MSYKESSENMPSVLRRVCQVFDQTFALSLNTRIQGGFDEPLYQPAHTEQGFHCIQFSHDYVASALHEIAHWCIAGAERRLLLDYGYWYAPDGRTQAQQREFESVEIKPQAVEWLLSRACALPFRLSVDNLSGEVGASPEFERAVIAQAQTYASEGLPPRAQLLAQNFSTEFTQATIFCQAYYSHETLSK